MTPVTTTVHDYLSLLGYLFVRHGKTDRAITILEALLVLRPDDLAAHRSLAYAFLAAGEHGKCLEQLDRAAALGSDVAEDQLMRIRALWGLGQHAEAREHIQIMNGRLRHSDV